MHLPHQFEVVRTAIIEVDSSESLIWVVASLFKKQVPKKRGTKFVKPALNATPLHVSKPALRLKDAHARRQSWKLYVTTATRSAEGDPVSRPHVGMKRHWPLSRVIVCVVPVSAGQSRASVPVVGTERRPFAKRAEVAAGPVAVADFVTVTVTAACCELRLLYVG